MEFIEKPAAASALDIERLGLHYQVDLPREFIDWWMSSNGPVVFFGYKELQFFSVDEIVADDYKVRTYMPLGMPLCMDGSANMCVARIQAGRLAGIYVVSCGDLEWPEAKLISETFTSFINDDMSPEERLNA